MESTASSMAARQRPALRRSARSMRMPTSWQERSHEPDLRIRAAAVGRCHVDKATGKRPIGALITAERVPVLVSAREAERKLALQLAIHDLEHRGRHLGLAELLHRLRGPDRTAFVLRPPG